MLSRIYTLLEEGVGWRGQHRLALATGLSLLLVAGLPAATAVSAETDVPSFDAHGPGNEITDVPGIHVGQITRDAPPFLTGITVVYAVDGAVGGGVVPGGWPGSINLQVLQPGKNPRSRT